MGIGLVDPILPSIGHELNASPSKVTLLFTSYLVVTAVAMLITNWVSSRLGAKKTLIAGLILIMVFSALAGASPAVGYIIGFRAGWGVGNALFIATSLAVIVASASGGFAGAIVLYKTALGIGIAIGPLPGGTLARSATPVTARAGPPLIPARTGFADCDRARRPSAGSRRGSPARPAPRPGQPPARGAGSSRIRR